MSSVADTAHPGQVSSPDLTNVHRVTEPAVTDAAWNAVAIASTHWQQSTAALAHILDLGRAKGMTMDDLRTASGLDEAFVRQLLDSAADR